MSEETVSAGNTTVNSRKHKLEVLHDTLRLQMRFQYSVITLTVVGIMILAWRGKLDTTVANLLAILLGYVLGSAQNKGPS